MKLTFLSIIKSEFVEVMTAAIVFSFAMGMLFCFVIPKVATIFIN